MLEKVYHEQADATSGGDFPETPETGDELSELTPVKRKIAEYLLKKARKFEEFAFRNIAKACKLNPDTAQRMIDETLETLGMKVLSIAQESKGGGYHLLIPKAAESDDPKSLGEEFEWNDEDTVYNNIINNLDRIPGKFHELLLLLNLSSSYTQWLSYEEMIEQTGYERKELLKLLRELKKILIEMDVDLARIKNGKEAQVILIHRSEDEDEIYMALGEEDEGDETLDHKSLRELIEANRERFSSTDIFQIAIALAEAADDEKAKLSAEMIADFVTVDVETVLNALEGKSAEIPKVLGKLEIDVHMERLTYGNEEDVYSIE
ncbi:hypothetical protein ACFL3C_01005 [Patescibacteria group bacterium]